ncbi:hypothetical protein Metlim_0203 [Methanoplanus limicola DSM 2279]|uniref:Uncharacterized protein n=1 Tax=Methanoplanus limicola DSM 2279 TaxID=937775 RepID=H1YZU3_9EURY|nr:hypothetical protein Metlim_0203 [Methanoplanus limicola DSM 2279]
MIYHLKGSNRFKRELKKPDRKDILKKKYAQNNLLTGPFADRHDTIPMSGRKR